MPIGGQYIDNFCEALFMKLFFYILHWWQVMFILSHSKGFINLDLQKLALLEISIIPNMWKIV